MKVAPAYLKNALLLAIVLFSNHASTVSRAGVSPLLALYPLPNAAPVMFDKPILATPLLYPAPSRPLLIVPASNGVIALLDAEALALEWQVTLPTPPGQAPEVVATPVRVGDKLIVAYHGLEKGVRVSHRLVVIDLLNRRVDDAFPLLEFAAEKPGADGQGVVKFNPPTAYAHAALQHAPKGDSGLGRVYVSFGNAGDTQPFHGWLFEVDLDVWRQQGAKKAVSATLLTTPEPACPVTIEYGTQEMICGGGIWTPAGPQIYPAGDGYEIFVPTGNGQIDLARRDYANALLRLKPGLAFDPGCDERLCANFNPLDPAQDCIQSCKNVFIPRLAAGNLPLKPASRACDNKTYSECLAWMDFDLGANAPVRAVLPDGRALIVQAGKDGGVSLLDAEHLGTQYDRLQIADVCGTPDEQCAMPWAGMIVTRPALSHADGAPVVVVPVFMPDHAHPAGMVALKIVSVNGAPKLERFWQFPEPSSSEAKQAFRLHPSLPAVSRVAGNDVVWIVDVGEQGVLYGIRVRDGRLLAKATLRGNGRPLSAPVIHRDTLYLASYFPETSQASIEAFRLETRE